MDTDKHGWGIRGATRVSLAGVFWGGSLLALVLALAANNAMLHLELGRLDTRLADLEAQRLIGPFDVKLSSVGVPLDVDRAMQMNSSNVVR
ncbi:MAG: hypothetical protein AAFV43_09025 [Planctomycetota bacterium]